MKGTYIATNSGSSINLSFNIGKYEISVAGDNSCQGLTNEMKRFNISVFRGENNVTFEIFNNNELISEYEAFGNEENILKAIDYCRSR